MYQHFHTDAYTKWFTCLLLFDHIHSLLLSRHSSFRRRWLTREWLSFATCMEMSRPCPANHYMLYLSQVCVHVCMCLHIYAHQRSVLRIFKFCVIARYVYAYAYTCTSESQTFVCRLACVIFLYSISGRSLAFISFSTRQTRTVPQSFGQFTQFDWCGKRTTVCLCLSKYMSILSTKTSVYSVQSNRSW